MSRTFRKNIVEEIAKLEEFGNFLPLEPLRIHTFYTGSFSGSLI